MFERSGGEQQRIAMARLLIKPDEPTGSLDEYNKNIVFSLLKELQKQNKTIVVVTHDKDLVNIADRVITL